MRLLLITILLCCWACNDPTVENRELAFKELEIKVDFHTNKRLEECRRDAWLDAEEYVDSIVNQLELYLIDNNVYQPTIPQKPNFVPVDSSVFNSKSSVKQVIKK